MNSQTLSGQWRQLRGKLKEKWGELTDDELDHVEGNVEQLVGLIQQKTGESREAIEHRLDKISQGLESDSTVQRMADTARDYADYASETAGAYARGMTESMQHSSEYVGDAVRQGYQQTEQLVRQRPFESLAVTFGAGVIAGVVVGLMVRHR